MARHEEYGLIEPRSHGRRGRRESIDAVKLASMKTAQDKYERLSQATKSMEMALENATKQHKLREENLKTQIDELRSRLMNQDIVIKEIRSTMPETFEPVYEKLMDLENWTAEKFANLKAKFKGKLPVTQEQLAAAENVGTPKAVVDLKKGTFTTGPSPSSNKRLVWIDEYDGSMEEITDPKQLAAAKPKKHEKKTKSEKRESEEAKLKNLPSPKPKMQDRIRQLNNDLVEKGWSRSDLMIKVPGHINKDPNSRQQYIYKHLLEMMNKPVEKKPQPSLTTYNSPKDGKKEVGNLEAPQWDNSSFKEENLTGHLAFVQPGTKLWHKGCTKMQKYLLSCYHGHQGCDVGTQLTIGIFDFGKQEAISTHLTEVVKIDKQNDLMLCAIPKTLTSIKSKKPRVMPADAQDVPATIVGVNIDTQKWGSSTGWVNKEGKTNLNTFSGYSGCGYLSSDNAAIYGVHLKGPDGNEAQERNGGRLLTPQLITWMSTDPDQKN